MLVCTCIFKFCQVLISNTVSSDNLGDTAFGGGISLFDLNKSVKVQGLSIENLKKLTHPLCFELTND